MKQALYKGKVWYIYDTVEGYKLSRNGDFETLTNDEYDYAIMRGDIKMLEKKNNIIEVKEEVQIGDIILEKGDKIEVLKESSYFREQSETASYLADVEVRVYEDSYEDGEGSLVNSDYFKIEDSSLKNLLDSLSDRISTPKRQWYVENMNDYTWASEVHIDEMQDGSGNPPSQGDIALWERGQLTLYSARYHVLVSKVGKFPVDEEKIKRFLK